MFNSMAVGLYCIGLDTESLSETEERIREIRKRLRHLTNLKMWAEFCCLTRLCKGIIDADDTAFV